MAEQDRQLDRYLVSHILALVAAGCSLVGPALALLGLLGLPGLQGLRVAISIVLSVFSVPLGVSALRLGFGRWRLVGGVGAVLGAAVWSWSLWSCTILSSNGLSWSSPEDMIFTLSVPMAWAAILAAFFRPRDRWWTVLSIGFTWPLAFIVVNTVLYSFA